MTSRIRLGICGSIIAVAGLLGLSASEVSNGQVSEKQNSGGQVEPIPVEVETRRNADEEVRIKDLMDSKLRYSEKILTGLVTHDFELIAESAESMKLIGLRHPEHLKKADDAEVYEHFRTEFARQASRLEEEAKKEQLAGAAYFAQNLTATCVACHDYIRDENLK